MKTLSLPSYEKLILLLLSGLIAIGGLYSYKNLSLALPLLTFVVLWREGGIKKLSFSFSPPLLSFMLLVLWGGFSIIWAEHQGTALKAFISLALTFLCSLLFFSSLQHASPKLVEKAYQLLKLSGIFLIVLFIYQVSCDTFFQSHYTPLGSYILKMKPTGSILGFLAFVSCGFLWIYENKGIAIVTFMLLFCLVALSLCQTALYALILSTGVFACSFFMPFLTNRIAIGISTVWLLFSPFLHAYVISPAALAASPSLKWLINQSFFHRILAWDYYAKKFFEKPWLGWGIESSRYLPTEPELAPGLKHLLHPHNGCIQAYVELGVIGGLLYAFFFTSLFYLVGKHVKDRLAMAVCNATLTFAFIEAVITHNAWRNYWLSLAALTAGLIILFLRAREAQLHAQADRSRQDLVPSTE